MSIDSQLLNLTGGIKTSGHIKSNFGATIGVGTDAPTGVVEVQHSQPTLVVQQQATSGGSVTSYGKVHAASGTLHIQSGIDATSDSKGDIVLGSVGSGTKHVVVKGATSRVGIGSDAPAYGLDVVPESRFAGNVITSNISANILTLNELSLGVTQGLDNVVNVDNTTANTIAMSNVNESTSRTTGALTVAGGIGVGGNVHCANLYASNITMNLVSFSGLQTFEQVVNNGRVLNSNVLIISNATPSTSSTTGALTLTGGGLGVEGNVYIGSNLSVTDETTLSNLTVTEETALANLSVTGETVEVANLAVTSGSLELTQVANVFQVKSSANVVTEYVRSKKLIKYPRVALTGPNDGSGYVVTQASGTTWNTTDATNNRNAWALFDGVLIEKSGHAAPHFKAASGTGNFDSSGNYTGTNSLGGVDGDWVSIQLPVKIQLHSVNYWRRGSTTRQVVDASVLGSVDGTNWDLIGTWRNATYGDSHVTSFPMESAKYHNYIALVMEKINGADGYPNFHELELFGVPEYDPDAHGTDVIARSVPNVPNTDWLEVYYDGQDYTSMPSSVTDKSGNSVTGTPSGVTFDSTWKAFSFDGSNDTITATYPSSAGDNTFSVSMWVKRDSGSGTMCPFILGDAASGEGIGMDIYAAGSVYWFIYGGRRFHFTGVTDAWFPVGVWTHVAASHTAGTAFENLNKVWINGVDVGMGDDPLGGNAVNLSLDANDSLTLGARVSANYLNGSIANFRIFNRALTGDEIWQLYAYQKDYFQVSPDVVTFKGGRLGIGTLEPKAPLDVLGIPYGRGAKPCFSASRRAGNVSTGYTIIFDHVEVNQQNGYNSTNGVFTAPVSGLYLFSFYGMTEDTGNAFGIRAYKNGDTYERFWPYTHHSGASAHKHVSGTQIVPMNTGDTFKFNVQTGTLYGGSNGHNSFVGYLIE